MATPIFKIAPEKLSRLSNTAHLKVRVSKTGSNSSGEVEPRLRVEKIIWAARGKVSQAMLSLIYGHNTFAPLDADSSDVGIGDRIDIFDSVDQSLYFSGHIVDDSMEIKSSPDTTRREFVAYGCEHLLKSIALHGQWCKKADVDAGEIDGTLMSEDRTREKLFTSDLPLVFNIDGRANSSPPETEKYWRCCDDEKLDDFNGCVFEPPDRIVNYMGQRVIESAYWNAYTALRSLVEYFDNYRVIPPQTNWLEIERELSSKVLPEIDVEALDLCQAMTEILESVGYGFYLLPWDDSGMLCDDTGGHILKVFPLKGYSSSVGAPVLARDDSDIDVARVIELKVQRSASDIANDIRVVGSLKKIGVALRFRPSGFSSDLHPAWDTDVHDLADFADNGIVAEMDALPSNYSPSATAEDFLRKYCRGGELSADYMHVFRSFVWNEDGAFSSVAGNMPDLTNYFGQNYTRRPRPVSSTFLSWSAEAGNSTLPAWVELGVFGDEDSWITLPNTTVMKDYAGFTINIPRLDKYYPYARSGSALRSKYYKGPGKFSLATLIYNALRNDRGEDDYAACFRLVGSTEADTALNASAAYDRSGSWPDAREKVFNHGRRFALEQLNGDANPWSCDVLARDDRIEADNFAANLKRIHSPVISRGYIKLHGVIRSYSPGMLIEKLSGRSILLGRAKDGEAMCVDHICWDFTGDGCRTELYLSATKDGGL